MSIGTTIMNLRKKQGLTQDALARKLGVTNQAVSKWELDQACPDIQLLPLMADIFDITIDELFGRVPKEASAVEPLPWKNDDVLYIAVFHGHELLAGLPEQKNLTFCYEGPAQNISSAISISCGNVNGNVEAGSHVSCGNVDGEVNAGSHVSCGNVDGDVNAGSYVSCVDVGGDVTAGGDVQCGRVVGNVDAGGSVAIQS